LPAPQQAEPTSLPFPTLHVAPMEKVFVTVLTGGVTVDVLAIAVEGGGVIVCVEVETVVEMTRVVVNAAAVYNGVVKLVDVDTVVGVKIVVVDTGVGRPRQLHALDRRAGTMAVKGLLFAADLLDGVVTFVVDGIRLKALSLTGVGAVVHVVTV
jgi:hypothetical protein